ncbi:MAG: hypothetical protein PHV30_07640 [Candidatus Margulisbacteria bacterium]|nr:hypothetical protein [Candidatus Margulisiibacteriota bacterium]
MFKSLKSNFIVTTGCIVIIFIACTIAFMNVVLMKRIDERINNLYKATHIIQSILEIRNLEKDFIINKDLRYREQLMTLRNTTKKILVQLTGKFSKAKHEENLRTINKELDNYFINFDEYAKSTEQQIELDAAMVETARTLDREVKDIRTELDTGKTEADRLKKNNDLNQLLIYYLEARRHEKNYILRHDSLYIERVMNNIQLMFSLSDSLKGQFQGQFYKEKMNDVVHQIEDYKNSFDKYLAIDELKKKNETKMVQTASNIQRIAYETILEEKNLMTNEMMRAKLLIQFLTAVVILSGVLIISSFE